MKYKVITDFGTDTVHIEKFETLEDASRTFSESIEYDAAYVYLLEVFVSYSSGDSCEKVLSFFKR